MKSAKAYFYRLAHWSNVWGNRDIKVGAAAMVPCLSFPTRAKYEPCPQLATRCMIRANPKASQGSWPPASHNLPRSAPWPTEKTCSYAPVDHPFRLVTSDLLVLFSANPGLTPSEETLTVGRFVSHGWAKLCGKQGSGAQSSDSLSLLESDV
jgi:hypothetical protein